MGARLTAKVIVFRLGVAVMIAALPASNAAMTQQYPERPVRLIVPAAPGGAIDVVGRIVANRLTDIFGQHVLVENRAGANNILGTEIAARAPADGYTLLTTAGSHTINPAVYRKLPYDALRDFTPISRIADSGGLVIVVHPSVRVYSLQDLIALARKRPGDVNYGSAGFGNLTHIAGEMFQVSRRQA
ncbi:MAG: hypothetical protein IT529_06675 [Burkholderiales bacterium]|nr:hypothetical protein [Burkholderiales bacterium]